MTVGLIGSVMTVAVAREPVDAVNPLIGAGSLKGSLQENHGKNFPGAATPSGMMQLSSDTITGGDNNGRYSYVHSTIDGFSINHMSGVGWYGDLDNFLVTATTGPLKTYFGETDLPGSGYLSTYPKETELAQPVYYAVTLEGYQILAELTATPTVACCASPSRKINQNWGTAL